MSKLSFTERSPGYYIVEGNMTFANIDKDTLKSFKQIKNKDAISIDLAKVGATDSAGLALMIEWIKLSGSNRVHVSFKNIPEQLIALAKLSGFDETEYFSGHG